MPSLLKATCLAEFDIGVLAWSPDHNSDILTVSEDGRTVEWGPKKPEYSGQWYPPAFLPASTLCKLHSGRFRWDFVVDEMLCAQIGIAFMLQWDIGPDWGFFGYLGASNSAWSYDPSTGDIVCETRSICGRLPRFADGHRGIVSVEVDLPRSAEGTAQFVVDGTETPVIDLPDASVILPAACLLKERQKVTLANFQRQG